MQDTDRYFGVGNRKTRGVDGGSRGTSAKDGRGSIDMAGNAAIPISSLPPERRLQAPFDFV